jgi:nucleotide-binding universal stress UspA family protein
MSLSSLRFDTFHTPVSSGRILVSSDLTDAESLVQHAIWQARGTGSSVTLVHVLPYSNELPLCDSPVKTLSDLKLFRDARMSLLCLSRRVEAQSIECSTIAVRGDPMDVITREIARVDATSLILGSHSGHDPELLARQLLELLHLPIFLVGLRSNDLRQVA